MVEHPEDNTSTLMRTWRERENKERERESTEREHRERAQRERAQRAEGKGEGKRRVRGMSKK